MPAFTPVDSGAARTINMRLTGTVAAGDPVTLGTNGVAKSTNGQTVFGFAAAAGVSGDIIAIYRGNGTYRGTADTGVDFANGDRVYIETNTTLSAGAATERSLGVVVDSDPASAGTVDFDFDPWGTFAHA